MTPHHARAHARHPAPLVALVTLLALIGVLVLFGLFAIITAPGASAHTPEASATCDTLTVDLTNYNGENAGALIIDGGTVLEGPFGDSYHGTFPLGDRTVAHTWKVKVRAHDDPDGAHGWSVNLTGTSVPCPPVVVEPEPTDPSVTEEPTPTEEPTTPEPTETAGTPDEPTVTPEPTSTTDAPPAVAEVATVARTAAPVTTDPALAETGAQAWAIGGLATGTVLLGIGGVLLARRRRTT